MISIHVTVSILFMKEKQLAESENQNRMTRLVFVLIYRLV